MALDQKKVSTLLLKCAALISLPLAFAVLEIAILPLDYFTFRAWEGLSVSGKVPLFRGPFYPNRSLARKEEGDLASVQAGGSAKDVVWVTDRFGYRNQGIERCTEFPTVVVGDSHVVGTGLTQSDTIGQRFKAHLGPCVFSFAPESPESLLRKAQFLGLYPRRVIYVVAERDVKKFSGPVVVGELPGLLNSARHRIAGFKTGENILVASDRLIKGNMLGFFHSRIGKALWQESAVARSSASFQRDRNFFHEGLQANRELEPEQFAKVLERVRSYFSLFEKRGIKLVFVPVPSKETIAYDQLDATHPPKFLNQLISTLKHEKLAVVDLLTPYSKSYATGELPYHLDDSHWNDIGTRLASEQIIAILD